jgi:hypothetical protein
MTANIRETVILGFNPLVGMDHYLRDRARDPQRQRTRKDVVGVVRAALASGAEGLNLNAGPESARLLREIVADGLGQEVGLYPMVPDERFFGSLLNHGTASAVTAVLSGASLSGKAKAVVSGGWAWMTRDPYRGIQAYLGVEIDRLERAGGKELSVRSVLVHELIVDSIMALGATEAFARYVDNFNSAHGRPPGFVTRNFVHFDEFCKASGIDSRNVIVLTPTNPAGFQMTPGRAEVERCLARLNGKNVIGMSLFGGGLVSFNDGLEYIKRLVGVKAVTAGVSTVEHARTTFKSLREIMRSRNRIGDSPSEATGDT